MSCEKHGYTNNVYCPMCDLETVKAMTAPPPDGVDCSERLPSWKQCEDACQFSCGTALERFIFDNEPADAVEEADFRSLLQAAIDEQTASLRARVTELEAQLAGCKKCTRCQKPIPGRLNDNAVLYCSIECAEGP